MPRILQILPSYQIGGINRYVIDLSRALSGFPNISTSLYVCQAEDGPWKQRVKDLNLPIFEGFLKGRSLNLAEYKSFIHIKHPFDIIHWHSFAPLLMLSSLSDRRHHHVYTHHSVLGFGRKRSFLDPLKWSLFRIIINKGFSAQHFNSHYTQDFWKKRGLKCPIERVIYNGMSDEPSREDGSNRDPHPESLDNANFTIGCVCNLIACKRVDKLIESFSTFAKGKDRVRLLIVGNGPEFHSLQDLTRKLHVEDKVYFAGHQENVAPWYDLMDIHISSSATETFGLVAIEAMSHGLPALCLSDGGGICEVIGEHSPDNLDSFEDLPVRMEYYYNIKQQSGTSKSPRFLNLAKQFSMKKTATALVDLYNQIPLS